MVKLGNKRVTVATYQLVTLVAIWEVRKNIYIVTVVDITVTQLVQVQSLPSQLLMSVWSKKPTLAYNL